MAGRGEEENFYQISHLARAELENLASALRGALDQLESRSLILRSLFRLQILSPL